MIQSSEAFKKLISDDSIRFETVLDIGAGRMEHSTAFQDKGFDVYTLDINPDYEPDILGDFCEIDLSTHEYDLIWCSHVLEHQLNVNTFLKKCKQTLSFDGWLAITVPPAKHSVVGGHVSIWNAGILLYNLVMAGFDCSSAKVLSYGYNISVIVQNKTANLPSLNYDNGDIDRLSNFFPKSLKAEEGFNGDVIYANWEEIPFDITQLSERYKGKPVCIIGNGPTSQSNVTENGKADFSDYGMPLWVCNGTFIYHPTAELCWMMDDIAGPASDQHKDPVWYRGLIRDSHIPVISCTKHEEYPSILEYPLADVLKHFNKKYFTETVNYAVAWAIMIGVSEIHLHGCDYIGCRASERAGLEYWISRAESRGIKVLINKGSMLMRTEEIDNINLHVENLYGYLKEPEWLIKVEKE